MELNLRKARKLEQKIQAYVNKMEVKTTTEVRVMATPEDRKSAVTEARQSLLANGQRRIDLINARFTIRKAIGQTNEVVGINELMAKREELQELLKHATASVEVVDLSTLEDEVTASKVQIEQGKESYGRRATLVSTPVATNEDLKLFKNEEANIKRQLEDVEDQLSQKNLGAKVKLSDDTVALLKTVGLV